MLPTEFGEYSSTKKQRRIKLALQAALAGAVIVSTGCYLPAMAQTSQYDDPLHGTYTPMVLPRLLLVVMAILTGPTMSLSRWIVPPSTLTRHLK